MRHAARAHAGPRQAGGGDRTARAGAAARGAAPDAREAGRRSRCRRPTAPARSWSALDLRSARGARRAQRRPRAARRARARPGGRRGHARAAGGGPRPRRPGRDQPHAAGGAVERAPRRGRRARELRPRPGRLLLRRRDPRGARPERVPRAVSRPLHAGQRVVGLVRPRGQPVLGPARRSAVARTSSCATPWTRRRSRSAGGRATPATAGRRSTPTRTRRRRGSRPRRCPRRPPAGRRSSASTSWTGTISAASPDPHATALAFARSAFRHACAVCDWDPALAGSAEGTPPPIVGGGG